MSAGPRHRSHAWWGMAPTSGWSPVTCTSPQGSSDAAGRCPRLRVRADGAAAAAALSVLSDSSGEMAS